MTSVDGMAATSSIMSAPSITVQMHPGSSSQDIHIYNTMFGEDRRVDLSQGDRRRLRIGDVIVFCDSAYCLVGVKNDTNITKMLQRTAEPNMAAQVGSTAMVPAVAATVSKGK